MWTRVSPLGITGPWMKISKETSVPVAFNSATDRGRSVFVCVSDF